MCGQLGFAVKEPNLAVASMMAAMSIFMDERGGHSWGYWADNLNITKGLGKMSEELDCHVFQESRQVIAHCRWATHGAIAVENSHPFVQGHIIGAHNGVIRNHDELNKQYPDRKFDVDSQHIFQHISDGLDLGELHGYGSVVWTDMNLKGSINFSKFNGGQFEVAEMYDGDELLGTVWASTEEALKVGIRQTGYTYRMLNIHSQQEYVITDSKPFTIDGAKCPILPAPKWTGQVWTGHALGYPTGGAADSNESAFFQGYKKDANGVWRKLATDSDAPPVGNDGNDEHNFVNALFQAETAEAEAAGADADKRLRTGDYRGQDVDRLIHNVWKTSGTFYHRGKCFSCCSTNQEVVKHRELGVRLCFDCCYEWEDLNGDSAAPADVLRQDFIAEVASRRGQSVQAVQAALEMAADRPRPVDVVQADNGEWFEVLQTKEGPIMGSRLRLAAQATDVPV